MKAHDQAEDEAEDDATELLDEEAEEAAPIETPPEVDENRWTFELQDVADVLERVLGEEQLTDRELVRGFLEAISALPNRDTLRHNLSPAIHGLASRRWIVKKHGLWMWIPADVREAPEAKHHDKKKPSAPAKLAAHLIWPPIHEPCGKLLPAGEEQARMWLRCARPGCHVRTEVIFYLPGIDEAERAGLAAAEVARGWACAACAVFLAQQAALRVQRDQRGALLRAAQRPMPSPSVICTLLRKGSAEGDALARDQLRIHREALDADTFERMMAVVFLELDQMAPTTRSPGKIAQHRARIGAFRLFAGWPALTPEARRRRAPSTAAQPPSTSPERRTS